ncbi:unnamed protein product [Cunninghamella blakesleeana]
MSKQPPSTVELKEIFPNNDLSVNSPSTIGSLINSVKNSSTNNSQTLVNTNHPPRPTAMQKNVAPFLNKVYGMVNDPSTDDLIRWSDDGKSFFVVRHEDFARTVLPRFFKHSNFSSFVRQLNMYGFHKVPHLQHGVLHSDTDSEQWEFSNPHFQRNQPDLLLLVTRKKGRDNEEKEQSTTTSNVDLHHILEEIQVIKQHQLNISSQLKNIQNDNSVLWQETLLTRDRYQRHQETIDKILRFLASVFSNDKSMAIPRKRRYLLEAPDSDKSNQDNQYDSINGTSSSTTNNKNKKRNESSPSKIQKISNQTPEFKLEDYVGTINGYNGNSDLSSTFSSSSLPQSGISSNPSSELADAIALNDKSKQSSSIASLRSSLPPDLSQVISNQQLQGIQKLISLAQSNPALLNQLTDAFNSYHQVNNNINNSINNNNNNNNNIINNNINNSIPPTISNNSSNLNPMTDYSQIAQLFDANTLNMLSNSMATIPSSMSSTSNPYTVTSPTIPASPSSISTVSFNDFPTTLNPSSSSTTNHQQNINPNILPYSEINEVPLSHSNSISTPSTPSSSSTVPTKLTETNNNNNNNNSNSSSNNIDTPNQILSALPLDPTTPVNNQNVNGNSNASKMINNGLATSINSNSLSTNSVPTLNQVTSDIQSVIKENDSVNNNIDNVVNDIFGFLNTDFLE